MNHTLTIGTRGSKLALIQARWVQHALRTHHPELNVVVEIIKTTGDKDRISPFAQLGSTGVFAKELEGALLGKEIDLAVHSLKDLQSSMPEGLLLAAIPKREDPRDVLITRSGAKLNQLPEKTVIGTSSARRRGILCAEHKNFIIKECRGNVPTRLAKLENGEFDAILLAAAGLHRMGLHSVITEYLPVDHAIPAVGQGALGLEIREEDNRTRELIKPLNHSLSFDACNEERAFLKEIGGGCHVPVGGHLNFSEKEAVFGAFVGTTDGSWYHRLVTKVPLDRISGLGQRVADEIKKTEGIQAFFNELD